MTYTIANSRLTATVDSLGAQLTSLKEAQGVEYLWVGDPAYWREHAPVLFPIVGALREGRTQINGQWYEMGRHGFAKHAEFTLASQEEDRIALTLEASPETRARYPFDFRLTVSYALEENGIATSFLVENTGGEPLPYTVGGHPGFNIPVGEQAEFSDYVIRFEKAERQSCPVIDLNAGLIDWSASGFQLDGREIPLEHSLFYQDALVFEGLNSQSVEIVNPATGRGIAMNFSGFPMLGVWSAANDGPYVCLEPWTGCATLTTEGDQFVEKKGMAQLAPGQKAEHRFTVRVL